MAEHDQPLPAAAASSDPSTAGVAKDAQTSLGNVEVTGARLYVGPNLHAPVPVLCLTVRAAVLEPAILERLEAHLSEQIDAVASSLVQRRWSRHPPADCTALSGMAASGLAGILAGLAVHLQALLGHDLQFAATEPGAEDGEALAIFTYRDLTVARLAGRTSERILAVFLGANVAVDGTVVSAEQVLRRFLMTATKRDLPAMQTDLALEAIARDIPWERTGTGGNTLELGQGCKLQRYFGSYTSDTSHIATLIATNKHQASAFFRRRGIPAAENVLVGSESEAVAAAKRFGYPVVIKPSNTDYGTAVSADLSDEAAVRGAYGRARRYGAVLVERHIPGLQHRLMVMYGEFVFALQNRPASVFGDGRHSVADLIEIENRTRGETYSYDYFKKISVDDQALDNLHAAGFSLESVPPDGQEVFLRSQANVSQGGTTHYVDDEVHPDNRAMAIRAARLVGMDVAGIDYITTDISRPYHETGGAICEINPTPGWLETADRTYTKALIAPYFPPGEDGRIPIVSILGGAGAGELAELVYRVLAASGLAAGLATRDGAMIAGQSIDFSDYRGRRGSNVLLRDPGVAAAVLECSFSLLEEEGLGFDRCTIGVSLAPLPDETGAEADEDLRARATALLATLSSDLMVVLADDPFAATLAEALPPERLCLVADDPEHFGLQDHRKAGGPAVVGHPDGKTELFRAGASDSEVLVIRQDGRPAGLSSGLVCAIGMGLRLDLAALEQGLDF